MTVPEAPKTRSRKADRLIGTLLADKYRIAKKIGEGGMGAVYIATQEPIDRKVAVKVLLGKLAEDEIAVKRFEQEARAISKMQHPNTVTIYDFGTTDEDEGPGLYIVMEYLKGHTLTQVLRKDGHLPGPRAARIVRQVCASLADAHAAGIIHRDLKPDNIFLTEVGGDRDWVKVLDFGVAKLADSEAAGTLTQTGMIFGTPKYMSPEQAEGKPLDYRADIYALGVVLYELLTGRPPFVADTPVGLLLKHIQQTPPPLSQLRPDLQVDSRLENIVMRALAKRPEDRFQLVSELASELETFERSVSGGVSVGTGTIPTPMTGGGLPTEVVPGEHNYTPSDLRSPDEVPPDLSAAAGVTGAAPADGATHAISDAQPTHFGGPAGPTAPQTVPSGSAASSAAGSTGLPATTTTASTPLLVTAVAASVAALGVFAYLQLRPEPAQAPVTTTALVDEVPKSPAPEPPEPAPEPEEEARPVVPEPIPVAKDDRSPAPRPSVPAPPPKISAAEQIPSRVEVSFESVPTGALVYHGKKVQGQTPFSLPLARGEKFKFRFVKSGYRSTVKTVVADKDQDVQAKLTKRPADAPREPEPRTKDLKVNDLK